MSAGEAPEGEGRVKFVDGLKLRARRLKGELTAVYYAFLDGRVGLLPKAILGLTLLYALSPIDLIPDFVPVLGYLDDLVIVPALIALAIRLIPAAIWAEARERAGREPLRLRKNWTFALLFLALWAFVLYLVARAVIAAAGPTSPR